MRRAIKAVAGVVVFAAAAAVLLWWSAPRLIDSYAARVLASYGWTLAELSIPRQFRFPVRVEHIAVRRGDMSVSASGIVISPITPDTYIVNVDNARIDTPGETSTTSIRELLDIAGSAIPASLPGGDIAHIEWCSESCIAASVHWRKAGDGFDITSRLPRWPDENGIRVLATVGKTHAQVSVIGPPHGRRYLLHGAFDWPRDTLQFAIDAHLDAHASALAMRLDSPLDFTADISRIAVKAKGELPMDAAVGPASLRLVDASFSADADVNWSAQNRGVTARGGQTLAIHGEYRADHSAIRLDDAVSSRIEGILASPVTATLGKGSGCDLQGETVDCTLQDTAILGIQPIEGKVGADLKTLAGKGHIAWQGPATRLARLAAIAGLSGFNMLSGQASATVDAAFDTSASDFEKALQSLRADFSLHDGNVTWAGYALEGIDFSANMAGWPRIRSARPATLAVREVNIGVPIKAISASFDLDASIANGHYSVEGRALSANTLGGGFSSHDFAFDARTGKGHVNLDLQGIQLGELLALEQEQLEGTGSIGGSVPIQIADGKLSIEKGKISAAAPGGTIRYKPNETVKSMVSKNAQLKLITDVMSDFRYDSLTSDINYSPDGKLTARTSLQGNNPLYQNGREIHFNLQLEENVGTLLKSLRLDNEVTRRIEDKVRKAGQGSKGVQP